MFVSILTSLVTIVSLQSAPAIERHSSSAAADAAHTGPLAARSLAQGRDEEALIVLERATKADPNDPAVLINLGVVRARRGETELARAAFEAALTRHEAVGLTTADGRETDSHRLARKALRTLGRGGFAPLSAPTGQLTLRD